MIVGPTKHHHIKKQKWGECNITPILIVVSWCPVLALPLLVIARLLRRRPCNFLVPNPNACNGHQESIIISRNKNGVSAISPQF